MEFKREDFFKKCKDDHDRLVKLIQEAGEVSVSKDIIGVVKLKERSYSVYLYKIKDKEYKVSKQLHEYLLKNGCLMQEGDDEKK